jgi:hypothetical protein
VRSGRNNFRAVPLRSEGTPAPFAKGRDEMITIAGRLRIPGSEGDSFFQEVSSLVLRFGMIDLEDRNGGPANRCPRG